MRGMAHWVPGRTVTDCGMAPGERDSRADGESALGDTVADGQLPPIVAARDRSIVGGIRGEGW